MGKMINSYDNEIGQIRTGRLAEILDVAQYHNKKIKHKMRPVAHDIRFSPKELEFPHGISATIVVNRDQLGSWKKIDWKHLNSLFTYTKELWKMYDIELPYNIGTKPKGYQGFYSPEEVNKIIHKNRRFNGWLNAAANFPGLRKAFGKGLSPRGIRSPRSKFYPFCLSLAFPSPGKCEHKMWQIKRRAEAILAAFDGQPKPAWGEIARVMTINIKRNGKIDTGRAALIVAANTLFNSPYLDTYRAARQMMIEFHMANLHHIDDAGIKFNHSPEVVWENAEVVVHKGFMFWKKYHQWNKGYIWVEKSTQETYHDMTGNWFPDEELDKHMNYRYLDVHQTFLNRKRKNDAINYKKELHARIFENPNFTAIVYFEDTYDAGNCYDGTREFLARNKIKNTGIAPINKFFKYEENPRVQRVLDHVLWDLHRKLVATKSSYI